jgi:putative membrane protein
MSSQSLRNFIILTIKGFLMGAANVIPGVSGGTMALILGIYEELINAIRSINLKFVRLITILNIKEALSYVPWPFLLPVGLGVFLATFSLAEALSWLLGRYPIIVWSFFFGLILSSVITVSRVVKKWRIPTVVAIAVGTITAYFLFGVIPVSTPNAPWFIFASGFIAICAMILPGISGAYILVLLGKYHYILEALNNKDFFTLFIIGAGALVGLISFAQILGWLLKKYHDLTMAILIGLMLGSLRKIWPWKETVTSFIDSHGKEIPSLQSNIIPSSFTIEVGCALLFMLIGILAVWSLDLWARKNG